MSCSFLHSVTLTRVFGTARRLPAFAASLVPPTSKGGKSSKISTSDAAHHLMKFIKVGGSTEAFLKAGLSAIRPVCWRKKEHHPEFLHCPRSKGHSLCDTDGSCRF